jgi:hypothetical protein
LLLHTLAVVATRFVHEPWVQTTVASGYVHNAAFVPLQVPAHGAVPEQPSRGARGLPVIVWHVPGFDGSLHASHCPLHVLSQHTVSAQKPDLHSFATPQFWPASRLKAQVFALVQ